jgi:hypothetical protein
METYRYFFPEREELPPEASAFDSPFRGGRAYADVLWRPNDRFEAQAGIHRTFLDLKDAAPDVWASPRFGLGVSPLEGQWLSCLVAERCWDQVRWAIENYTWRFDGSRRPPRAWWRI